MKFFGVFGLVSVLLSVLIGGLFLLQPATTSAPPTTMNATSSSAVSSYGDAIDAAQEAAAALER